MICICFSAYYFRIAIVIFIDYAGADVYTCCVYGVPTSGSHLLNFNKYILFAKYDFGNVYLFVCVCFFLFISFPKIGVCGSFVFNEF